MTGYKGKLVFYKTDTGFNSVHFDTQWLREDIANGKKIFLAETDVDVVFADTRKSEIEALEKKIEEERANSLHKINIMLGKIQELRAIEHVTEGDL